MEHWYLREHGPLQKNIIVIIFMPTKLPCLAKLPRFLVLAGLVSDQLVDVLHVLVSLHLLLGHGAENQLEALLRLQGGCQGDKGGVLCLVRLLVYTGHENGNLSYHGPLHLPLIPVPGQQEPGRHAQHL